MIIRHNLFELQLGHAFAPPSGMKMLALAFIFSFLTSISAASNDEAFVSLGSDFRLPLKGQDSVWVQDGKIVKVDPIGSSLRVRGLKEGSSLIKIGPKIYTVQVLHPQSHQSFEALEKKINRIVGLRLSRRDGRLSLEGQLYRWSDWQRAQTILKGSNYVFRAQIAESLRPSLQSQFDQILQEAHLPPQALIFEQQPEVRIAASELQMEKYKKLYSSFGVSITKDESSLDLAPTIKVQITVAEIRRDLHLQYGMKWPASYSARIIPPGFERTEELLFNAKALEDSGHGRILASPNIICRSGKEAEFLAGGEFPIKILNYKMQDIVWKRYGILLKVKPKADSSGRMSISLETEITTIDKSMTVDGIPGLLTNRVSSHFDLSKPQTIALSGLIKSEEGEASSGIPLLSRIPILGPLFSSKDFHDKKTELVIFVRPSIMNEKNLPQTSNEHLRERL